MGCRLKCVVNKDNHMCCLECPDYVKEEDNENH